VIGSEQIRDDYLRQGDICRLDAFPQWSLEDRTVMAAGKTVSVQMNVADKMASHDGGTLVAVCTQCCDLRVPGKTTGLLLAPVRVPPMSPNDTEMLDELERSNISRDSRWSFVSLYPLRLGDESQLYVVDFGKMMSLHSPKSSTPALVSSRVYRLTPEARERFRTKLAASLCRPPTEDESEAIDAVATQ